jgi:hypothetical protein
VSRADRLSWDGPILRHDGVEYLVALFRNDLTTPERFVIWKSRPLLEASLRLIERLDARRIVELGIAQGGSIALFAGYATDAQLVALDFSTERIEPLDAHLADAGLVDRVHLAYGVDQSDRAAVLAAIEPLGPEPLDLVLDDASHRYAETVASFDLLFPRLRPGGGLRRRGLGLGAPRRCRGARSQLARQRRLVAGRHPAHPAGLRGDAGHR